MELRTLLTSRKTLVLKIGDVENQIRGSLHPFGIKLGTAKRRTFAERVRELTADLPRVAAILDVLLQAHSAMLPSLDRLNRMMLGIAREHAVCRRLMTVPGVGAVVGRTFIAAIEDPAASSSRARSGRSSAWCRASISPGRWTATGGSRRRAIPRRGRRCSRRRT